ncbi:unnamed protein product [Protopolystoma xenopodis]|uniref:Uncharacterized protein n=1 Tax=Protopolystoma xenopodis TaxID=117903 RepID=A0A3S5B5N9_9PLAT|nr:unnamed protein product [Protopolystoma xenopodis]
MAICEDLDKKMEDFDYAMSKIYRGLYTSGDTQPLPKCWNLKDRSRYLKVTHPALVVAYRSNYSSDEMASVRSDSPIPLNTGIYYFEVTLLNKGVTGYAVLITH